MFFRDLRKLENLQELNISGNMLRHLPRAVGRHSKLQALRSNANLLKELPDFRYSTNLKVLRELSMVKSHLWKTYTVELQWLKHLRDHETLFETGVVRANEC